jgi:tRNA A-37 threonylcarbamoyl transferase component Bud32
MAPPVTTRRNRSVGVHIVVYGRVVTGPPLLASGRDADVFVIDERRVLRRYRDGGDVTAEAAVMAYVVALGFPAPKVYEAVGTDLVMQRLVGTTMLEALVNGTIGVEEAAAVMAQLHRQLHELPARLSADPAARVLHLDLHPDNVILSPRGPVLIDWRNAAEGPPQLDLALSALILAEVAVGKAHAMASAAHEMLTAFLREVDDVPPAMLDRALAIRRANPTLTAEEVSRLEEAASTINSCE